MTKDQATQATADHFAACAGWAMKVVDASFQEQREKETLKLVDAVINGGTK